MLRRRAALARREAELASQAERALREQRDHGGGDDVPHEMIDSLDDPIGDDLLRLVFTTCHPALAPEARVALTLRLLGGLRTEEIARAFLVKNATIGQRISRAKRTLKEHDLPFEVPDPAEIPDRLPAVLEVVYLIFNEGYAATSGESWTRTDLIHESLRLGRVLAGLLPGEPEVLSVSALMELQASRIAAREGPRGEPVLLADQDRARWDRLLITRGLRALERARALEKPVGPYRVQAEIAACHARARSAQDTDWQVVAALYAALAELTRSPVVELNRAVAVSMADGPQAALPIVDALAADGSLEGYHLLPSVRADLLARLGRSDEARQELGRAIAQTANAREREMLEARAAALDAGRPGEGAPVSGSSPPRS